MLLTYLFNKVFPALPSFKVVEIYIQVLAKLGVRILQIEQLLRVRTFLAFLVEFFVEGFLQFLVIAEFKAYHKIPCDFYVPAAFRPVLYFG